MVRLRCPRCKTEIQVEAGATPVCPSCGFGSPPAAATPAPQAKASEPPRRPAAQPLTPSIPPPPIDPLAAPLEYTEPAQVPMPVRPAPTRGWVMPTIWGLLALDVLLEGAWFSMATDPAAWRTDGSAEPFTAAILVLVTLDIVLRCVIGILVARDLKAIGAGRLKMAQVPATGLERTSPTGWGVTAGIFTILVLVLLSIWRGRIRTLADQASMAPQFSDKKELKAAHKKPGVFPESEFKAMRRRGTNQTLLFVVLFIGLNALSRI
ncbi:MAG: TFIIB-type zinc ribbon-containing protein [Thermoplasmatota archaeon]